MLRNLVSNAIKYGSADTPIRIALHGVKNEVHLEVSNSGSSVDPSARRQIFDPLKRGLAEADSRHGPDGLGLGLFIVREIVSAHGGDVDVRSGGGDTTFTVRLPRQRPSA